jgi:para-aminobenzoate synthetase component II
MAETIWRRCYVRRRRGSRQEAGGRRQEQEAGGRRQEAGGRRQEAGGRRQEAGGRRQEQEAGECINTAVGAISALKVRENRARDKSAIGNRQLAIGMLLVIDNYDSFTYNLVQYLGELGETLEVRRNDEVTIEEIASRLHPSRIVISPGPGTPDDAGVSLNVIKAFAGKIPILGVCLGHQAIGQAFGGKVVRAPTLMHGKASEICHDGKTIFQGIDDHFRAGRYHSLMVEKASLPDCLEISAFTADDVIMGLRHRELRVEGVQFHPESILTNCGKQMLANFLKL